MFNRSWEESLDFLRTAHAVPAAQANAILLVRARGRWSQTVIARTSMHDLLFTLPGDTHPSDSSVRVHWAHGQHLVQRWSYDHLVEEAAPDIYHVHTTLDVFLERLTSPARTCRSCGSPVVVSAEQFEVFEGMHYTCFHYLFEHDPFDRDEECAADGCPSVGIQPARRSEEPRDSLVEELIDDLMFSELGKKSVDVRIQRRGPGVLAATFDAHSYLITVRTEPRRD